MNTLKLGLTTLEIDENENEISSSNFDLLFDYNEVYKTSIILPVDESAYTSIPLSNITSPFLAVLSSDRDINYKLNDVEYTASQRTVINTPITSLSVYNPNTYNTTINIIIYGVSDV